MRIQYTIQNKTQVETVNFRLYFKVIFRQNEIQYFTIHIYIQCRERASVMWAERRIIQAKRNMIKKLVITENGLFSYIYNNVSYIEWIKVERYILYVFGIDINFTVYSHKRQRETCARDSARPVPERDLLVARASQKASFKDAVQSDLRMCTKEPVGNTANTSSSSTTSFLIHISCSVFNER